jgi:hypothetical protein
LRAEPTSSTYLVRGIIMKPRVSVVNQEATTLTSLENVRMRCPSSENLFRDHKNGTQEEGLYVVVTL